MRKATIAALSAALALSAACVDDDGTLVIIQNQALDDNCEVPAGRSDEFLPAGLIDADFNTPYLMLPLIETRTATQDTEPDPLARAIALTRIDATSTLPGGGSDTTTFFVSGLIEPGGSRTVSAAILTADTIGGVGDGLSPGERATVLVELQAFGQLGGDEVASRPFTYPVTVCAGCLSFLPPCLGYMPPQVGNSCVPGQDGFVADCCLSSTSELRCPGVAEEPPPQ